MNLNQFTSEAGTFSIDAAINGQTPLGFYDPLKQVAYQPAVRKGAGGDIVSILPYKDGGFSALFSQLKAMLSIEETKMVKARKFWWAEYDQLQTMAFAINKSLAAVPAGGIGVTVNVSRASLSQNGVFAKPLAGYKAIIKENDRQIVTIRQVRPTPTGYDITFDPINGQVLDLTKRGQYTVVLFGLKEYVLGTNTDIQTHGLVGNPPALYQSFVQKFEDGFAVHEDEVDNYVYDKEFFIAKGLDEKGNKIDFWYVPAINVQAEAMINANRNLSALFNRRDTVNDRGFDGVVPTIENYGMFNSAYDIFLGGSFKSILMSMIKSLRKINGANEYFLIHDFNFGIDWAEAIASLINLTKQNHIYSLFGSGGEGDRDFNWYNFGNFSAYNYHFKTMQMDSFDSYRFGRVLEYFAMALPARSYVDTDGNRVPIMNFVNIEGAEKAKDQEVWVDDARKRGGRKLNVFVKDSFGIEIHKATQLGMISRGKNSAA